MKQPFELKKEFVNNIKDCYSYLFIDEKNNYNHLKDWELQKLYTIAKDIAYKIAKQIDYRKRKPEIEKDIENFKTKNTFFVQDINSELRKEKGNYF
jgi:hypothetical protein